MFHICIGTTVNGNAFPLVRCWSSRRSDVKIIGPHPTSYRRQFLYVENVGVAYPAVPHQEMHQFMNGSLHHRGRTCQVKIIVVVLILHRSRRKTYILQIYRTRYPLTHTPLYKSVYTYSSSGEEMSHCIH